MAGIDSVTNSDIAYGTMPHAHDAFMVMLPERGLIRFTDEENDWSTTLAERQFLLVPPRWGHSTRALTEGQSHHVIYVNRDDMRAARKDMSSRTDRALHMPGIGIWEGSAPLHQLLRIKSELRADRSFVDRTHQLTQIDNLLLLECVAISLGRTTILRSTLQRHGDMLLRDIRDYLAGNLSSAPNLDHLADQFNVSRRHLTRLFADRMGDTILGYVQRLRIERSKELLRHTRLTILEIAQSVGFQSPSHFAEIFRRAETVGPDKWRRQAARQPSSDH